MSNGPVPEDWLVGEVGELLDVGPVWLYEFVWLQRGQFPGQSSDERIEIASLVLERLLVDGARRLAWMEWPDADVVAGEGRPVSDLPRAVWGDPSDDGRYLAVMDDDGQRRGN